MLNVFVSVVFVQTMTDPRQQNLEYRTVWIFHHEELDILLFQGVILMKIPRRLNQSIRPYTSGSHHFSQRIQLKYIPHCGKDKRALYEKIIHCEQQIIDIGRRQLEQAQFELILI